MILLQLMISIIKVRHAKLQTYKHCLKIIIILSQYKCSILHGIHLVAQINVVYNCKVKADLPN